MPILMSIYCAYCNELFSITRKSYNDRIKHIKTNNGICCSKGCANNLKKRPRVTNTDKYVKEAIGRFWSKVDKTQGLGPQGECWEWGGTIDPRSGYGDFCAYNKNNPAHRFSWELANNKKIRKGYVIMHSCDNRKCVNPDHLSEGTISDNTIDMVRKGRHTKGGANTSAKVSDDQVLEIRKLCYFYTKKELANMFNTSIMSISHIVNNKSYKHLPHTPYPPYKMKKKPLPKLSDDQLKYLISNIKIDSSSDCWLWGAFINDYGYGRLGVNKKVYAVHRIAYAVFHNLDDIDPELVVRHGKNCPRHCVSPFHLQLGTNLDNSRDRWQK